MTLTGYAAQRHVPLGGTFELTARCNLKCKMCYIRLDKAQINLIGRERTANVVDYPWKRSHSSWNTKLLITGGEPLLRPDFAENIQR